jgi:hypothetical protein
MPFVFRLPISVPKKIVEQKAIFPLHWGVPMINANVDLRLCSPFQFFKQLCVKSISSLSRIFDELRMSGWQAAYVMTLVPDYVPKRDRTRSLDTLDRGHSAWQEMSAVSHVQADLVFMFSSKLTIIRCPAARDAVQGTSKV